MILDSNRKCSHFIGYYNQMMSNFAHLNPESVVTLFKSYCCYFYGSFLWKYNSDGFGECCTQWNKCIIYEQLSTCITGCLVLLGN